MSGKQLPGCPCCDGTDVRFLGMLPVNEWFAGIRLQSPLPGGMLLHCGSCGMKFRDPLPDTKLYERMYGEAGAEVWAQNPDRQDFELIASHLNAHLPAGARVLDYGCYTGALLAKLGDRFETNGIEVNRAAARLADAVVSGRVWRTMEDIPDGILFDGIVLSDVIEHMPHPRALLERLAGRLAPGGLLAITTGDADSALWNRFGANWWYCFYPEHIRFMSRRTLSYLSRKLGLSLARCDAFSYSRLSPTRRAVDGALMRWYGFFPKSYLGVAGLLARLRGSAGVDVVPGCGLSEDHIFAVMKRNVRHGA